MSFGEITEVRPIIESATPGFEAGNYTITTPHKLDIIISVLRQFYT